MPAITQLQTYQDTVKNCPENEWPNWVSKVRRALEGRAVVFTDLPPFAYKVYEYLKSNPEVAQADSN